MREKIRKSLLILSMAITVLPMLKTSIIKVEAKTEYNHYNFACPAYEVDTISDSGEFVLSSCQGSFAEAKAAMNNAGPDAVVRSRTTYSANWIVAMTRGYAYSYSVREGVYTVTLRQNTTSSNAQTTYVNNCRMMLYKDTSSYNGDGTGTVLVDISGFEGNAELKQLDLVPSKFVDRGLPIWMGGNDITVNPDTEWQVIPRRPYYTAETNGNYTDLVCYSYSSVPNSSGTATDITYGGMSVGVAPTWMEKGKKYYSWDDTNFYSDPELKNYVNTYYNYYQFVSYRTKSRIPSSVYNSYLSNAGRNSTSKLWNMGDRFISDQETYGINAAMVFVQACDESAYGTSNFALNRNNLFGVAAYDSNPNDATDFSSAEEAIDYQMSVLLKNYCTTSYGVFNGDHFGNKGSGITVKYASSSYYGLVLSSLYYDLDKFANGYSGNLTDYQSSLMGILNDQSVNVYSSSDGSKVMYTTEYTPTYQNNYTVSILGSIGDYYKVQSTNYVDNGLVMDLGWYGSGSYNWSSMVGYIKKSDFKYVQTGRTIYNGTDYSAVYDYQYYLSQNSDVAAYFAGDDAGALWHFVTLGMDEGRIAKATFNVRAYKANYSDLRNVFGDSYRSYYNHYISTGQYENRETVKFLTDDSKPAQPKTGTTTYNGTDYSAVYDYQYYLSENPDVKAAFGDDDAKAIWHFVTFGMSEGRIAKATFDVHSYRNAYADLRHAFGSDFTAYYMHYITTGQYENRSLLTGVSTLMGGVTSYDGTDYSAVYDFDYYLQENPDVKAAFGDDDTKVLWHFVTFGMSEGRIAKDTFNVFVYRNNNGDLRSAYGSNLRSYYMHYIIFGQHEQRICS